MTDNGETGKEYFAGERLIRRAGGDGYLLTEKQSIMVAMLAGLEDDPAPQVKQRADAIRIEIVQVLYAIRHGDKVPPMPVLDDVLKDFSPWGP